MTLPANIEIHFFRGDLGKGQDPWMYSIRDGGYRRGESGGKTLLEAAIKAALDAELEQRKDPVAQFEAVALLEQALHTITGK